MNGLDILLILVFIVIAYKGYVHGLLAELFSLLTLLAACVVALNLNGVLVRLTKSGGILQSLEHVEVSWLFLLIFVIAFVLLKAIFGLLKITLGVIQGGKLGKVIGGVLSLCQWTFWIGWLLNFLQKHEWGITREVLQSSVLQKTVVKIFHVFFALVREYLYFFS